MREQVSELAVVEVGRGNGIDSCHFVALCFHQL